MITHNDTILTAMNLNNRLDKRVDILKQAAAEKEELEHKDMKQNSVVITVTTEENSDDSERSESDNGESEPDSDTTTATTTTDDDTAEQDSRVF